LSCLIDVPGLIKARTGGRDDVGVAGTWVTRARLPPSAPPPRASPTRTLVVLRMLFNKVTRCCRSCCPRHGSSPWTGGGSGRPDVTGVV